jgi:hypothetical protein
MTHTHSRLARLFSCLLMFGVAAFASDPAKTVVSDIIYRADGSPASGTLVISWPAFVSAENLFGNKAGVDKKDAALNFVSSALAIAEAVSNKDIADVDKFRGGLGLIIDGTVQCLNASVWAGKAK